jgi:hypothetical protein
VIEEILQDIHGANIELDAPHTRDMIGVEELSRTGPGYENFAYDVIGSLCQYNIVLLDSGILARVPFAARRGDVVCHFTEAAGSIFVVRPTDYGHSRLVGRVYTVAEIPDVGGNETSISLV